MRHIASLLLVMTFAAESVTQTTQGLISGRIVDSHHGTAIRGARIIVTHLNSGVRYETVANGSGHYALPLLSPGLYQVRVEAGEAYQPREVHGQELPVAASLRLDIRLRPRNDVLEQNQQRSIFLPDNSVLIFFGPDVDTSRWASSEPPRSSRGVLETTVSDVVHQEEIRELPLMGRDVYTLLAFQPGVTSDATTTRGLGLSVNGQRPSASNFLLDGVEHNNYLVTGPLTPLPPEAVQEYRVSTNSYTAEYGRASGLIANAVTRSGRSAWHGLAWFYAKNDALNANDFQRNSRGLPRNVLTELQPGISVGGPVRKNSTFVSGTVEHLRSRSFDEVQEYLLPGTGYRPPPGSAAERLLRDYPAPRFQDDGASVVKVRLTPPVNSSRWLAVPRLDSVLKQGKHRFLSRVAMARFDVPDLIWTPYEQFNSGLVLRGWNFAAGLTTSMTASVTNELRGAWSEDDLRFDRAHPEIPRLISFDGVSLPGSPGFFGYRNRGRNQELLDSISWLKGAHVLKFGGGVLLRSVSGYLAANSSGEYSFRNLAAWSEDMPHRVVLPLRRDNPAAPSERQIPAFDRDYRYTQFFAFAQDSFRLHRRLTVNYGVRYESFGAPANTGVNKDVLVEMGTSGDMPRRVSEARLIFPAGSGNQQLYAPDRNDWSVRSGASFALQDSARTILRGSWGIFYDRPFENLWQNLRNNSFIRAEGDPPGGRTSYLSPADTLLPGLPELIPDEQFNRLTVYESNIRTPYVHSYFAGLQHQFSPSLFVEINTTGSAGRKLITTDIINRPYSLDPLQWERNEARYHPVLGNMHYRANQGLSDYHALTTSVRYRGRRLQAKAAWTWSHTIDNQSEPLLSDFFDLGFTRTGAQNVSNTVAAFTRQFDAAGDRANSDFDQRHNIVLLWIWEPSAPRTGMWATLLGGWRLSGLAAFRTGFPYSVRAGLLQSQPLFSGGEPLLNNRTNLLDPARALMDEPANRGRRLLNRGAFSAPRSGVLGTSGRNAFSGPGMYNIDLSVSRSFALRWLGEGSRLRLRADIFNALNHANLGDPLAILGVEPFGVAQYGRTGHNTGFPLQIPFAETARQIQLMLRVDF